jgi:hypothetical protein
MSYKISLDYMEVFSGGTLLQNNASKEDAHTCKINVESLEIRDLPNKYAIYLNKNNWQKSIRRR